MKNKKLYIISSVCILSVIMNIVDVFIKPGYFIKSLIKIVLFLFIPGIYFIRNIESRTVLKKLFRPEKKYILKYTVIGIIFYCFITGGYMLLGSCIDFSAITGKLSGDIGVDATNFVFVAVYIALCNSLLEELFFRVFAFSTLNEYCDRKLCYLFSSVTFAFYHIGMTLGWVNIYIYIAGFMALVCGGIIFDNFLEKTDSIYPSWIVHMFINFGINTIGLILFGII